MRADGLALLSCSTAAPAARRSPTPVAVAVTPSPAGCTSAAAAAFDFWVGSWSGRWTDAQGQTSATDVVIRTGCEIDEAFSAPRFLGHSGYSATNRSEFDSGSGSGSRTTATASASARAGWAGSPGAP